MNTQQQDILYGEELAILIEKREYNLFSILKPKISIDGNSYCVLYGDNLQEGIAGFGETLYLAILNFNKQFHKYLTK